MKKIISLFLIVGLFGCSASNDKKLEKPSGLGERSINYYANKSVTSLEVPPDLTKPSVQNSFKLSKYVDDLDENIIGFSGRNDSKIATILENIANIEVKKSNGRRWLLVDKKPEVVWNLSKSFLKSNGFVLKKINKKIGIMETDFLENKIEIPDQSLGLIRSLLKEALKARYSLPIVDKYRVRIEPAQNGSQTEVYLSLTSMEEVVSGQGEDENTIWQSRTKDQALEDEMLYRLMTYLGSSVTSAKEKIAKAKETHQIQVRLEREPTGYAKLIFSLNQYDTWTSMGWAFDQLGIDVEDKDVKEGSFYISIAKEADKGIFSRMFGDHAIKKTFQILVKSIDNTTSVVYFNDLSEKNTQETIDFSHDFLSRIAQKF
jgi:outer membrane protein assembly factor BamC